MSLQTRLSSLITAIGADVKSLQTQIDAVPRAAGPNNKRVTADLPGYSSNTVLTSISALDTPVAANQIIYGRVIIWYTAAAAATGLALAIGGPTGASVWGSVDVAMTPTTFMSGTFVALDTAVVATASNGATLQSASIDFLMVVGATAGTLSVKYRSEVNASAVVVKAGSYISFPGVGNDVTIPVNLQTGTSYTAVLADAGKVIEMNNASANSLIIPPSVFDINTMLEGCQIGSGQTTIVAGSGVTINPPSKLKIAERYGSCSLRQRVANEWIIAGNLAA